MTTRRHCTAVLIALLSLVSASLAAQPAPELENVAAFARLYGVARWFYPSDAAASLDWNRFAVHGVRRVRAAETPADLERTLLQLFTALGPGIEIGASLSPSRPPGVRNDQLIAWHYRGAGFSDNTSGPYSAKRLNRAGRKPIGPPTASSFMSVITAPEVVARANDMLDMPIAGAVSEFVLARGLRARVTLSLTNSEARTEPLPLAGLRTELARVPSPSGSDDIDVRLADVVVAWSAFRHFYPYWSDLTIDWDARLRPQLATAYEMGGTRQEHLNALRLLVADLQDGHGGVHDIALPVRMPVLPISMRIIADQLVVTASRQELVPVGSVITQLHGKPSASLVSQELRLASGTPQWKRTRAELATERCKVDIAVPMKIEPPTGPTRDVSLPCTLTNAMVPEVRPDSIVQLEPGLWYVDLTRVKWAQLRPKLGTLSKARGVVFDVRGYPTDAGAEILPHLMTTPEQLTDRWMHVPRFARPFGEVAGWQDLTWSLRPQTPRVAGQRIFLTDGRAISYAESVMGYVRDYQLGTIIGGTTAGANGNVASFTVPGGFSIVFTGMRVTRHDGKTAFHTVGVPPDAPVEPTLEGIRAGRDEVLERALAVLRKAP